MAMQEFIATFAVDIDESGVNRLQGILKENTGLAETLASAFRAAQSAMQSFVSEAGNVQLPFSQLFNSEATASAVQGALTGAISGVSGDAVLSVTADLTKAQAALNSLKRSDATRLTLTADASGVTAAANNALSAIKSSYANTTLTLKAEVKKEGGAATGSSDSSGSSSGSSGGSSGGGSSVSASGSFGGSSSSSARSSTGGRFTRPTLTEVAEDSDPEYIIPIRKESTAVPLIRRMLGELSASARASLSDASALSSLPAQLSAIPSPGAAAQSVNTVQAPVNITVNPSSAQPEAVGRSVYHLAERYLAKTLQGVFV